MAIRAALAAAVLLGAASCNFVGRLKHDDKVVAKVGKHRQ